MKLGIIGYSLSGRSTVFEALTGARGEDSLKSPTKQDQRIGTVTVADRRVDFLSEMYKPKKTAYAKVEYLLPSDSPAGTGKSSENAMWNQARICDALIHVIRNFSGYGLDPPALNEDFSKISQELMLADFLVAEKRLERLALDQKRGKKFDPVEISLLQQ